MQIIYVVLDIDKYGTPEIVDYFLSEDEARELVAKRKDIGYENATYSPMVLGLLKGK